MIHPVPFPAGVVMLHSCVFKIDEQTIIKPIPGTSPFNNQLQHDVENDPKCCGCNGHRHRDVCRDKPRSEESILGWMG